MIILDGNAIAARSFFGTHAGVNTFNEGAFISAFLKSMLSALTDLGGFDKHVVLCVDSPSWRKSVFPAYKDKPKACSPELYAQYKESYHAICADIRQSLPIAVLKERGYEADDLVAWVARKEPGPHIVVSQDKDLKPLIQIPGVRYYNFVDEKFEVIDDPEKFVHILICTGDSSDNVPGIMPRGADGKKKYKFGEKTAEKFYSKGDPCNISKEFWGKIPEKDIDEIVSNYTRNAMLIDLNKSRIFDKVWYFGLQHRVMNRILWEDFFMAYLSSHYSTERGRINALMENFCG